jgi:hypothetical protein
VPWERWRLRVIQWRYEGADGTKRSPNHLPDMKSATIESVAPRDGTGLSGDGGMILLLEEAAAVRKLARILEGA